MLDHLSSPTGRVSASARAFDIELAGQICRVSTKTPELAARLRQILRPYLRDSAAKPGKRISASLGEDGSVRIAACMGGLRCDLRQILAGPEWKHFTSVHHPTRILCATSIFGPEPAVEFLDGDLIALDGKRGSLYFILVLSWLLLQGGQLMNLHAAVTAIDGCAIVLVGASGSGKSTLAWALHQAGADYFGDEWAFFTLPDYALHVWDRAPALRPGGFAALGSPFGSPAWYESKPGDSKCIARVKS